MPHSKAVEDLIDLDKKLFALINGEWTHPLLDQAMPVLTDLHKYLWFVAGLIPFLVAIWVFKFKTRAIKTLILIALAIGLSDAVSYRLIKPYVDRPRPQLSGVPVHLLTHPHTGKSFPSNHAANNFSAATVLSFAHPPLAPLFFAIAFIVGYSRIYVGVHFPFDVLGGALLGILIATLLWTTFGYKWINKKNERVTPLDPLRKHKSPNRMGED